MSRKTLHFVAGIIRRHRACIGSLWRKLNPGQQALLVLAYLRKGETFAELAAGFGVGVATAWRYVNETVALLAAAAPTASTGAARDLRSSGCSRIWRMTMRIRTALITYTLMFIPSACLRPRPRRGPAGGSPG